MSARYISVSPLQRAVSHRSAQPTTNCHTIDTPPHRAGSSAPDPGRAALRVVSRPVLPRGTAARAAGRPSLLLSAPQVDGPVAPLPREDVVTPPAPARSPRPTAPRAGAVRRPRRPSVTTLDRRTLAVGVLVSLLASSGLPSLGWAVSRHQPVVAPAAPAPTLAGDVESYLAGRHTRAAVVVRDLVTGQEYRYRPDARFDSASVVKIAIMATVLRQADAEQRRPGAEERRLLRAMVERSDNGAASTLWNRIGRGDGLDAFLAEAGMTRTTAGPRGYWGVSQVTAADQVLLMSHLTQPTPLLSAASRAYAQQLMGAVDPSQDWGVSSGPAAAGAQVQLKNGWLPRGRDGWAVHSVGHVQGGGRDYLVAVLSVRNATQQKGIATVQGVSRIVWRDLAPR